MTFGKRRNDYSWFFCSVMLFSACLDHDGVEEGEEAENTGGTSGTAGATTTSATGTASTTESATASGTTQAEGTSGSSGESGADTDSDLCGEVVCENQLSLDLSFQQIVSPSLSTTQFDGVDWVSEVDASAGGIGEAPNQPWLYLRFGDQGLEKVNIDDFTALTSSDWDIAAKRFGIRVNSGTSGPGCVDVAAVMGAYESIDTVPANVMYARELFYDEQCVLIEDGTGLAGSPNYRMSSWWSYVSCVETTGQTFVLRLADQRVIKLVVENYYQEGQLECNEQGVMGTGSAQMRWRWRFL